MNTPDNLTDIHDTDGSERADRLSLMATILGSYLGKSFCFDGNRPYYLSSLLPQLRKNLPTWTVETENVLKSAVVDHGSLNAVLSEMAKIHPSVFPYRIVRHNDSPGKIGLVPADSLFEYSDSAEHKQKQSPAKSPKTPRTNNAKTSAVGRGQGKTLSSSPTDVRVSPAVLNEILNVLKDILGAVHK